MDRKPDRREYSNARRRPSAVNRTQGQNHARPASHQPASAQQNGYREPNRTSEYSFRQGQRPVHPAAQVPARRETALTKKIEKRLAKIEKHGRRIS